MVKSPFVQFPLSVDWILIPSLIPFRENGFSLLYRGKEYSLYSTFNNNDIGDLLSDYFVFGRIIESRTIKNDSGGLDELKGYFTSIQVREASIEVCNDSTGVAKFFYSLTGNKIVSSRLNLVVKYDKSFFDPESVILYLLFNYNIWGRTFFKNIFFSEPGTRLQINEKEIKKDNCRKLNPRSGNFNRDHAINQLSDLWIRLFPETYGNEKRKAGLTLTGGYDSRLVLAGLIRNDIKPYTFTFGNTNSADSLSAKIVADTMGLKHISIPFDYCTKEELNKGLIKITNDSDGLLNPFRIIRLKAIMQMYEEIDILFLGYGGSELLRGIFPEGLLVSDFYSNYLKSGDFSKNAIKRFLKKFRLTIDDSIISAVHDSLNDHRDYFSQFNYMINLILPMHFGEDLRFLLKSGYDCYSPFLDKDFIDLALKSGLVPLHNANISNSLKDSRFKRINNPEITANLLNKVSMDLMRIKLNRGYSPNDYIFSKYYAGLKLMLNKFLKINSLPVTQLNPWLNEFFENYLLVPSDEFQFDSNKLYHALSETNPKTEYDFLPWTRLWNVGTIMKLFTNLN